MSDTIGTFWIVTKQDEIFKLGDEPKATTQSFSFKLTEENYNSWAYISLMVKGVDYKKNKVSLNGHFVGYLDPTSGGFWTQQTLIVEVYGQQVYGDGPTNELVIETCNSSGGTSGNLDDFEVKHIIFHHRTNR